MKKISLFVIAAALLLALTACGTAQPAATATEPAAPSVSVTAEATAETGMFDNYGTQGYTHQTIAAAISPYLAKYGMNAISDQFPDGQPSDNGVTSYAYKVTDNLTLFMYENKSNVVTSLFARIDPELMVMDAMTQYSYLCITLLGAFEGADVETYAEMLQITSTNLDVHTATSSHCSYTYAVNDIGAVFSILVF